MDITKEIIDRVLEREGGFTNNPLDRGGPTKFGITRVTLENYLGEEPGFITEQDVEDLDEDLARDIYRDDYWYGPGFDTLDVDERLLELIFDTGVNHGTFKAIRLLQKVLGVDRDGVIGPVTRAAVTDRPYRELFVALLSARIELYGKIVQNDESQRVFIVGWLRRMNGFLKLLV